MTEKPSRPICRQCRYYQLRRALEAGGWEAYCTARSRHGRVIDWQYGMSPNWAKKELKDKMEIRICPGWCPEWRR